MARATSCMKMNGIATGKVVRITHKHTAKAPNHWSLPKRGREGGSGI